MNHRSLVFPLLLVGLAACSAPHRETPQSAEAHGRAGAARPVEYTWLGVYSYRITTSSPDAQRWFDQGLRLVYAFNHHEAQRAFRRHARLDPGCAMCYWGIAITEGSNYNHPTDADREKRALDRRASRPRPPPAIAQPAERAMIQALAKRHSADPAAERAELDARLRRRHARGGPAVPRRSGGRHVLRRRHDEPPAVEPVDARRQRRSRAPRSSCRRSSACSPRNPEPSRRAAPLHPRGRGEHASPGAPEAPPTVWRALMPGAGHMVHMPSHIYWRVGRYADAVTVNVAAVRGRPRVLQDRAAEPDLPRALLPAQHRLHLAVGAACRGAAPRRCAPPASSPTNAPAEMIKADAGHGDRAGRADRGARALRPLGRGARLSGAARASGPTRRVCGTTRAGSPSTPRARPPTPRGELRRARGRAPVGAGRAHRRVLLPREERAAARGQRPGRRDRGEGGRHAPAPSGCCAPRWPSRTRTGSPSRRRGTSRCASRWAPCSCRPAGRPTPRRSTARTCAATRATAGRCTGSPQSLRAQGKTAEAGAGRRALSARRGRRRT